MALTNEQLQLLERGSLRVRARTMAIIAGHRARTLATKARKWKVTLAAPGIAGIGLVSASAGLKFGLWAGLGMAGLFLLRIDSRL